MQKWFDDVKRLGLPLGTSFDLDFHTIPYHGDDALMQKHYVSKRSRRQKGVLAFVAQDASTRVFCYGNAQVRKENQNEEVIRFAQYWRDRTGHFPQELVFDSRLTTYAKLNQLNQMGICFITLRRRSPHILKTIADLPESAWRTVHIEGVSRIYRTPRVFDKRISLGDDYKGPIRQMLITDLGHEEPTVMLTNRMTASAPGLIKRYAERMLIENSIADGIDFFHMDALSSAVAMKVDCDLQLTLMASSLYRLLAHQIGREYANAKSRHLFRDFVDATASVTITEREILVRFQKRTHNPFLLRAGMHKIATPIPWLGRRRLQLIFG
jgi:hypothetical protein